jgi:hypothetical protein
MDGSILLRLCFTAPSAPGRCRGDIEKGGLMVRKSDAWTRARDSLRRRPKARVPKAGWVIAELSALTGHTQRTIRYYLQQGVLSALQAP